MLGYLNAVTARSTAILLVLTIGLVHGANDMKIISRLSENKQRTRKYVAGYISVFFLTSVAFYFFPLVALILFIFFSCYHFGEQHWLEHIDKPEKGTKLFAFFYGMLIIMLILQFNAGESVMIINDLLQLELKNLPFAIFTLIALFPVLVLGYRYRKLLFPSYEKLAKEILLMLVFIIIFNLSGLVWSFAVYFILWHSLPSLRSQLTYLYGSTTMAGVKRYIRDSLPFWLLAIIGLGVMIWFLKDQREIIISIFFPFIAALTMPHVVIMSMMFGEEN
nr:Brp/Blh family beta-carotene 15,15'-dioxygenase [Robertkochia sp. 3YJGBD-33]